MAATITAAHNAYRYAQDEEFSEPAKLLHCGYDRPTCKIIRDEARALWEWNCLPLGWMLGEDVWVRPSALPEFTAWWAHHDPFSPYARPATAHARMTRALAEYGITAHLDKDAGNSWLVISMGGHALPTPGVPHLVAYVYEEHEDWVFVDAPMEHWAGTWQVAFNDGKRETVEHCGKSTRDPGAETVAAAAFIADRLTAPTAA
ncbi:hypothetical protein [Streptomyces sp. NPDC046976]|uniref:hypothetical protein n=1 Tax=Streptomyces sp. NPDC046976 TaxID=3155258 RepID=UPI0033EC5A4A